MSAAETAASPGPAEPGPEPTVVPAPAAQGSAAPPLLTAFVLLGALLTFMLEPLVGRLLLPTCGGGSHVWTTSLMFFQGALCLGYLQCHLLAPRLGRLQLLVYLLPLPFLPLATLTITPDPAAPVGSILIGLVRHVAVPFAALSTTAVVAQLWLTRQGRAQPWRLYAASNWGSFVGLFAYPFLVEPLLPLHTQRLAWSAGYLAYLGLALVVFPWRAPAASQAPVPGDAAPAVPAPSLGLQLTWLLLAFCPSAFLLAVTNVIAMDVGSAPFVWVLPLGLYLLSFVFVFRRGDRPWWVPRGLPLIALAGLDCLVIQRGGVTIFTSCVHLAALLVVSWAAHGELVRLRPDPAHLARFYLALALGGWGGGVFVSLVAPNLFTDLSEYPVSLLLLGLVLLVARWREMARALQTEPAPLLLVTLLLASLVVAHAVGWLWLVPQRQPLLVLRNAYGLYRVFEERRQNEAGDYSVRRLYHGSTVHGGQLVGPLEVRRQPISYYHPASPLADVMRIVPRPCRAAVIGLGSGACAAWFGPGDALTFYELDPDDQQVARECFTYLSDFEQLAGEDALRVVEGDARLRLADDPGLPPGGYDLIIVDAFSSDAIPTHLLTQEALALYEQRLAPGGWLLFHISTRYHDLRPVLRATSAGIFQGAHKARLSDLQPLEYASEYYALRRPQDGIQPLVARGWTPAERLTLPALAPWTDDHCNLLAPFWLKVRERLGVE